MHNVVIFTIDQQAGIGIIAWKHCSNRWSLRCFLCNHALRKKKTQTEKNFFHIYISYTQSKNIKNTYTHDVFHIRLLSYIKETKKLLYICIYKDFLHEK